MSRQSAFCIIDSICSINIYTRSLIFVQRLRTYQSVQNCYLGMGYKGFWFVLHSEYWNNIRHNTNVNNEVVWIRRRSVLIFHFSLWFRNNSNPPSLWYDLRTALKFKLVTMTVHCIVRKITFCLWIGCRHCFLRVKLLSRRLYYHKCNLTRSSGIRNHLILWNATHSFKLINAFGYYLCLTCWVAIVKFNEAEWTYHSLP